MGPVLVTDRYNMFPNQRCPSAIAMTQRTKGLAKRTREEIVKWNQMTSLRFHKNLSVFQKHWMANRCARADLHLTFFFFFWTRRRMNPRLPSTECVVLPLVRLLMLLKISIKWQHVFRAFRRWNLRCRVTVWKPFQNFLLQQQTLFFHSTGIQENAWRKTCSFVR